MSLLDSRGAELRSGLRCPRAMRPKANHHTLQGATPEACCDRTSRQIRDVHGILKCILKCTQYELRTGPASCLIAQVSTEATRQVRSQLFFVVETQAYWGNVGSSPQICCDKMCGLGC